MPDITGYSCEYHLVIVRPVLTKPTKLQGKELGSGQLHNQQ